MNKIQKTGSPFAGAAPEKTDRNPDAEQPAANFLAKAADKPAGTLKILQGKKVGFISLGCDKNRVDTEKCMAILRSYGCVLTNLQEEAEIIVVNTCAFLEKSRKEAIETVLSAATCKAEKLEKLVVTGCLPAKYVGELYDALPEVDVFAGFADYEALPLAIAESYRSGRQNVVGKGTEEKEGENRVLSTPLHYAYLKIADGCDNHCTYCLIPKIRGKYRSFPMEKLVEEAENLGDVAELILVAQDVTRYGEDLYGENRLVGLLRALSALENVGKIRLLYCYPDKIDDALIDEIAQNKKIVKYIDIPLQHADGTVLKRMNRPGNAEAYLSLLEKLRKKVPEIAVRSTFIAGFPGETEEKVQTLEDFLKKARMHNVGFFAYSKEPDTAAYRLKGHVPAREKNARVKRLFAVQKQVADEIYSSYVGKTVEVLCDGIDYGKKRFVGRADFQAPEIDGVVYFTARHAAQGERYIVKINRYKNYDLYGEATE